MKSGVISCLKRRADEICDSQLRSSLINHLKTAFKANGCPRSMITQAISRHKQRWENQDPEEPHEKPKILYLPYVKNTSEENERECTRFGVKVVFKSYGTLRQALVKVKTLRDYVEKKDVYEVPCMDCDKSYIGKTERNLKKQIVEHKYAVKRKDDKNGIAVHANDHNHRVDWEGAKVLEEEPRY